MSENLSQPSLPLMACDLPVNTGRNSGWLQQARPNHGREFRIWHAPIILGLLTTPASAQSQSAPQTNLPPVTVGAPDAKRRPATATSNTAGSRRARGTR